MAQGRSNLPILIGPPWTGHAVAGLGRAAGNVLPNTELVWHCLLASSGPRLTSKPCHTDPTRVSHFLPLALQLIDLTLGAAVLVKGSRCQGLRAEPRRHAAVPARSFVVRRFALGASPGVGEARNPFPDNGLRHEPGRGPIRNATDGRRDDPRSARRRVHQVRLVAVVIARPWRLLLWLAWGDNLRRGKTCGNLGWRQRNV